MVASIDPGETPQLAAEQKREIAGPLRPAAAPRTAGTS